MNIDENRSAVFFRRGAQYALLAGGILFLVMYAVIAVVHLFYPYELEWMELEGKKASRIKAVQNIDVGNSENWEQSFLWLTETAQDFQTVFATQMKDIKI